jgi:hypothetical protein
MTDDYVVATDYGGDDHGPHKEIPPPEIFASEEDELKWIAFTAGQLKRLGDQVMTSKIVEPSGPKFWSGPVKEDLPPGRITEVKLEEDWKKLEKGRMLYQGAALSVTNTKKDSELTQLLDCRTKRGGDELTQEVIKKRRTDLDATVKRLKAKQEKEEQDAREAAATAEREEREERKRKEVEAKMRAIFYEARKGKTSDEFEVWRSAYQAQQEEQAQNAKEKWEAKIKQDAADKAAALAATSQEEKNVIKIAEQKAAQAREAIKEAARLKQKADAEKATKDNEERLARQEDEKKKQAQQKEEEERRKAQEKKDKKAQEDKEAGEKKKAEEAAAAEAANAAAQNPAKVARDALNLTKAEEFEMDNWTVLKFQGVQIDFDQFDNVIRTLYDKWEPWHNTHFRKAPAAGVPDVRLQIEDNLNARAFVVDKTPLQFVAEENFPSINAYIDRVINEMGQGSTRLPPLTSGEVFENGLWARAAVEKTTRQVIARRLGFMSIVGMRQARLQQLDSYPTGLSKDQWQAHQQFLLEHVGDYAAELQVAEEKVRDHKANKILAATVPHEQSGLGFEF